MNAAILAVSLVFIWVGGELLRKFFGPSSGDGYLRPLMQCVFGYAVFAGFFALYEWRLELTLSAFDVNRDGIFSGGEISAAQSEAMVEYINDAGRNVFKLMAPAVYVLIAIVWSGVVRIRRRKNDKKRVF